MKKKRKNTLTVGKKCIQLKQRKLEKGENVSSIRFVILSLYIYIDIDTYIYIYNQNFPLLSLQRYIHLQVYIFFFYGHILNLAALLEAPMI